MNRLQKAAFTVAGVGASVAGGYVLFSDGNLDILGDSSQKISEETIRQTSLDKFMQTVAPLTLREKVTVLYFEELDRGVFHNGATWVPQRTDGNGLAGVRAELIKKMDRKVYFGDQCLNEEYDTSGIVTLSTQKLLITPTNPKGVELEFVTDEAGIPVPATPQTQDVLTALGCDTNY